MALGAFRLSVPLLLVVACGGDHGGTDPNRGITVSGVVRDRGGEAISGATVLVPGRSPVTSGPDGRFSVPDVAVPYDITFILGGQKAAVAYKGLTRSDPTLLYIFDFTGADQSATVSGTTPPASGKATLVLFVGSRNVFGGSLAHPTTGQYAFTVPWRGSSTTHAGQLYVLRFTRDSVGLPASYDGYASKAMTISAGGDFSGNDFVPAELTDPAEQAIGGSVAVPPGYALTSRSLYLFIGGVPVVWDEQGTLPNSFTYTVPAVSEVAIAVSARAENASSQWSSFFKSGISGNSTNVSIPLEASAQLASPADEATAVDATTRFSWSQGGGTGINVFEVLPYVSTNPRFFVFTAGTEEKVPDLAGEGMGLPSSARYRWFADRVFPVASTDDAADVGLLRLFDLAAGDYGATGSGGFDFTTKATSSTASRTSLLSAPVARPVEQQRAWVLRPDAISANRRSRP